ncbi:putative transmembrane protein [Tieghemostelium lacteum]|uniref:Putative transmembrane protein n=1 Tax=Tieghemostelium lacteum TaxID=361077 RepID=A0A151ZBD8_TIELA|nr:putative transmembrane protein [Tieghemostelium lacteum]|eukprot:KYQ91245.1 putative transmembrane protein [Tieghemostelium lacteum]
MKNLLLYTIYLLISIAVCLPLTNADVNIDCSWFVDSVNGDPANTLCTSTAPCKTIFSAFSALSNTDGVKCNDTIDRYIYIASGTYKGAGNAPLFINFPYLPNQNSGFKVIVQAIDSIPASITTLPLSNGTLATVVDADGKSSLFLISFIATSRLVFIGLTFQNGVQQSGSAAIDSPMIIGSQMNEVMFINCKFLNNKSMRYGALSWGPLGGGRFENCQFTNNQAVTGHGGAIHMNNMNSRTDIINSKFLGNKAVKGGALYASLSNLVIQSTTFSNSTASADGGALFLESMTRVIGEEYWTDLTFQYNFAARGGAIYDIGCVLSYQTSTFLNNSASTNGGAITFENSVSAVNLGKFNGNTAPLGGAVYVFDPKPNDLPLVIKMTNFTDNIASQMGGAMYCDSATATLNSSNIYTNNRALTNQSSSTDYCTSTCLTTTKTCACFSGCGLPPVPVKVITDKRETKIAIGIFLPVTAVLLGIVGFLLWKTNEKKKLQKPQNLSYDEIRLNSPNYEKQVDDQDQNL